MFIESSPVLQAALLISHVRTTESQISPEEYWFSTTCITYVSFFFQRKKGKVWQGIKNISVGFPQRSVLKTSGADRRRCEDGRRGSRGGRSIGGREFDDKILLIQISRRLIPRFEVCVKHLIWSMSISCCHLPHETLTSCHSFKSQNRLFFPPAWVCHLSSTSWFLLLRRCQVVFIPNTVHYRFLSFSFPYSIELDGFLFYMLF